MPPEQRPRWLLTPSASAWTLWGQGAAQPWHGACSGWRPPPILQYTSGSLKQAVPPGHTPLKVLAPSLQREVGGQKRGGRLGKALMRPAPAAHLVEYVLELGSRWCQPSILSSSRRRPCLSLRRWVDDEFDTRHLLHAASTARPACPRASCVEPAVPSASRCLSYCFAHGVRELFLLAVL